MKIYRIISDLPDGRFLCYIGSTSKELNERLTQHKLDYNKYLNNKHRYITSFKLVCRKWFEIALVEDLGDCSKDYMLDKETYYINYYKGLTDEYKVINKCNPNGLDINKFKQYQKQYEQSEKRKEYKKQYNKSNKYKEYQKKYYQNKKIKFSKSN